MNIKKKFSMPLILIKTYFFIQVRHQVESFKSKIIADKIIPNNDHNNLLKEEENLIIIRDKNTIEWMEIIIKSYISEHLANLKEISKKNSKYAKNINEILKEYQGEKTISLKYI